MTQVQLCVASGVSQATISGLETEARLPDKSYSMTIARLADALEVNPQWLLTGEGSKDPVTTTNDELMDIAATLSPQGKAALLAIAKTLQALPDA